MEGPAMYYTFMNIPVYMIIYVSIGLSPFPVIVEMKV